MKRALPLLASLPLFIAACTSAGPSGAPSATHSQVLTSAHAIAAVRHEIKSHGGNPDAYEYRAGRRGSLWFITAWKILHPQAEGAARFETGKFDSFIVNAKGYVIESLPGR